MTKLQEILMLTKLEEDIILNGRIEREEENSPFEKEKDRVRLNNYHFFDLQDKYSYGWYIAECALEDQIKSIDKFKAYILNNYKED